MGYVYFNPNGMGKKTTDCVIRMLCAVYGLTWTEAYDALSDVAKRIFEIPSSNTCWGLFLSENCFVKHLISDYFACTDCMTIREFANLFPVGTFVACTGSHVVAVINGSYYDAWDSGDENVDYFYALERR